MATTPGSDFTRASSDTVEASRSAVSWAAIVAGAVVAIATTLVLLALGAALGFATASPWPGAGASAAAFAIGTGIWLIVTQWLSSTVGGYITGRLRTRWTGTHTNEVFFRDTAHGFLTWSLATVVVTAVAFGVGSSVTGAVADASGSSVSYATDTLLRSARPDESASAGAVRAEVGRILAQGDVASGDRTYLASVISTRTGVTPDEAQRRVDAAVTSIRSAADKARKASAATAFFAALSMVIGAFVASVAAAYAGRLRDEHA